VIVTPAFGALAVLYAMYGDGRPCFSVTWPATGNDRGGGKRGSPGRLQQRFMLLDVGARDRDRKIRRDVESDYRAAVAALAMAMISDPALGHPQFRFVGPKSPPNLNRLSWFSTTPYLSVIVGELQAEPARWSTRLENYFWLSCRHGNGECQSCPRGPGRGVAISCAFIRVLHR